MVKPANLVVDRAIANSTEDVTQRHPRFYFDATIIYIQIRDTLFNVHKSQLLKSEAFVRWFESQDSLKSEDRSEGLSPNTPIVMQDNEISDFEALLEVLYTPQFSDTQPSSKAPFIISAFRMADLWQFLELRACLLPRTDQVLDDVSKIAFAKEFGLKEWLLTPHVNLCQRDQQLDLDEARKIGIDSLLIINNLREEFPPQSLASYRNLASSCKGITQDDLGYSYGGGGSITRHHHHFASKFSSLHEPVKHCSSCLNNQSLPAADNVRSTIESRIKEWIKNN